MNAPNYLRQPRLQDRFNIIGHEPILSEEVDDEMYAGLYKDWRRDVIEMRDFASVPLSRMSRVNVDVVKDTIDALTHPSFHQLDFLFWTTLPYAGLRSVWRYVTGFNEWNNKRYPYHALQQLVPYDVFSFWLQVHLNGSRWRRPNNKFGLYTPTADDYLVYVEDDELLAHQMVIPLKEGSVTMSLMEYADRIFLGHGGVFNDLKVLDLGKGLVLQLEGTLLSGKDKRKVLTPPMDWRVQRYVAQLTYGELLPYFYEKILEGWLHCVEPNSENGD